MFLDFFSITYLLRRCLTQRAVQFPTIVELTTYKSNRTALILTALHQNQTGQSSGAAQPQVATRNIANPGAIRLVPALATAVGGGTGSDAVRTHRDNSRLAFQLSRSTRRHRSVKLSFYLLFNLQMKYPYIDTNSKDYSGLAICATVVPSVPIRNDQSPS